MTSTIVQTAVVVATVLLAPSPSLSQTLKSGTEILAGCEGEGCGCTKQSSAREAFTLRSEMHRNARVVKKVRRGAKARHLQAFSVVREEGEYIVTNVSNPSLGVQRGDRLHTVFHLGEGFALARSGMRRVEFEQGQIEYAEIRPSRYAEWHLIAVGQLVGFSESFPFEGCLE